VSDRKAYSRAYYLANRERILKRVREYQGRMTEAQKQRRKERSRDYSRHYRIRNLEIVRDQVRARYWADPEKERVRSRRWASANRDFLNTRSQEQRKNLPERFRRYRLAKRLNWKRQQQGAING
jgi:hypothetical protein